MAKMNRKWNRIGILMILLGLLLVVGAKNLDSVMGVFWHLTHSSDLRYANVQIRVTKGWLPWYRRGSLILVRYPDTDSSTHIALDQKPVDFGQSPKDHMEKAGRIFDGAEKVTIDGIDGLRVTAHIPNDTRPYLIIISFPSQNISLTYLGSKENIVMFDDFIEGLTFVKAK